MPNRTDGHDLLAKANPSFPTTYSARARFVVAGGWLEHDGAQILAGPQAALEQFADLLNLLNPPRRMLPQIINACRGMARGSHFTVGEALRRMAP